MHSRFVRPALFVVILTAVAARAASAQTCIAIDEQHDMLGRDDRTAARLLVGKQFELAGHRVANATARRRTRCPTFALARRLR